MVLQSCWDEEIKYKGQWYCVVSIIYLRGQIGTVGQRFEICYVQFGARKGMVMVSVYQLDVLGIVIFNGVSSFRVFGS